MTSSAAIPRTSTSGAPRRSSRVSSSTRSWSWRSSPVRKASSAASTRPRCCSPTSWASAARTPSSNRSPTATPSRPRRSSCASGRGTAPSGCTRRPSSACWPSRPAGRTPPASAWRRPSPQPVISFGARHVHPHITDALDYAAIVGGCVGASTPAGARLAGLSPTGTMPHSLVLVLGRHGPRRRGLRPARRARDPAHRARGHVQGRGRGGAAGGPCPG